MVSRSIRWLLCVSLITGTAWAGESPFLGKWKLNPARSQQNDVMKVHALGSNKYDFNLGGDTVETIVVDGTDQAGSYNSTLAVTAESPDTWRVVRKSKGRTQIIGIWKLSADGNTLQDNFTSYRPNGTTFHLDYIYQRTDGGPGFDGTWESATVDMSATFEIEITPSGEDGILLNYATFGMKKNVQFDGKDYPIVGGNAPAGLTVSAHRADERTIETKEKVNDKEVDTQRIELSPDGKTLTFTVSRPNRKKPEVQVLERE